jgi:hypothetical protein
MRDLESHQEPTPRGREAWARELGVKGGAFADETPGYPMLLTNYGERIEK